MYSVTKNIISAISLVLVMYTGNAQLTMGGFHANFGIDADTRSGYQKFGPAAASVGDDWFSFPGRTGNGVIDTTGAAYYRSQLQAGRNISFIKTMSMPAFAKVNGKLWMDAIYIRDHSIEYGKDTTTFKGGDKNGHNPATWNGNISMVPPKIDIVDAYAHFRRDGGSVNDSLWFFSGVSTLGVEGDRYYDIELYKGDLNYNKKNGDFTSDGLSTGHTEWIFDPLGNIIQTGDLIIAVSYKAGQAPVIDVRIWISRLTFNLIRPRLFNFGSELDGNLFGGFTSIYSKDGSTSFGSGIANFTNGAIGDSTYSTPWGSTVKNTGWTSMYESLHFMEVGVNFSRIGIDPSAYITTLGAGCRKIFSTLLIKSRASNSFTSALHDFAGPVNFGDMPASMDLEVKADTITCQNVTANLSVNNPSSIGSYSWSTLDGNILSANDDNSVITVNRKGTYHLHTTIAKGCPVVRVDKVKVLEDDIQPVATADITLTDDGQIQLVGGDTAKSNALTPFGKSKGLKWDWAGPNGFNSREQSPVIQLDWVWGNYNLAITENRNGCVANATLDISFRNMPKKPTEEIAAAEGDYLWQNGNKLTLVTTQEKETNGTVVIIGANGQILGKSVVNLNKGRNQIALPVQKTNQLKVVTLYLDNEKMVIRKTIF